MKILHVVPSFGLGGMEKVLCSIINGISQDYFHEILALDNEIGARQWIEKGAVKFLPFSQPPSRFQFFRNLYRVMESSNPHILMTYNWGATDAIWLGRCAGIRIIIHNEHGFNVDESRQRQWKRNVIRFVLYRLARQVVVVSRDLEEMLNSSFCLQERQVTFIPNGIDCAYYSPNPSIGQNTRKELGIKENEVLVGFVGRLDPVKNFDLMLEVFEFCLKQNSLFKLVFIGDGPERQHIESSCKERLLSEHVLLVGQKDEVLPYLRALDVLALTSFREEMPMSMLEALAVGIPVVASAVGEIPYIIEHGKEGFLCQLEDSPHHWATCVLLATDPERKKLMSRAARQKAVDKCDKQKMILGYQRLLQVQESEIPRRLNEKA